MSKGPKRRKKKRTTGNYKPCVYIVGSPDYNFVKIGTTQNPADRFEEFQTASPFELYVYAIIPISRGRVSLEKRLHKRYAPYRLRGEWFKIEGDLLRDLLLCLPHPPMPFRDWLKKRRRLDIKPDWL